MKLTQIFHRLSNQKSLVLLVGALLFGIYNVNSQVKTDSLILYYPFSNNVNDESGNQLNGLLFGATPSSDRFTNPANAYDFNGTTQYIGVPSNIKLRPTFPFAISLWVKIDQFNNGYVTLYSSCEVPSVYSGFNVKYSPSGIVSAQYGNALGTTASHRKSRNSTTTLTVGKWHHVAVSFKDSSNIDLFIDGVNRSGLYSGSASSLAYTLHVGAIGKNITPNGIYYHNGLIDDIRLYSDSLSLLDAQYLYYESPCINQIEVHDTTVVIDTILTIDTVAVFDTITNVNYVSSTDTMYIDLPQNPESIKVYANSTSTRLFVEIGSNNLAGMTGYSINITSSAGQQVFYSSVNVPLYNINILSSGFLGLNHLNILNNQGILVESRKLYMY